MADGKKGIIDELYSMAIGHRNEKTEGVKDWVISTLGPASVGKTALISGLYAKYHLGTERSELIGIESVGQELHDMLNDFSKGMRLFPSRLPEPSTEVKNGLLKFMVRRKVESFQKIVALQDHAGEHLQKGHREHDDTINKLKQSDSFMVFLDSRNVLRDDMQDAAEAMKLNLLKSIIRDISLLLSDNDIIPISVVLSKSDRYPDMRNVIVEKGIKLFENLSIELPQCVFCFTPVSVVHNGRTDEAPQLIFSPYNAEVPFLFCLAGVVLRNAVILSNESDAVNIIKRDIQEANLDDLGFFQRMAAKVGRAIEVIKLDMRSKRYARLSAYDLNLANNALEIIKDAEHVKYMRRGIVTQKVKDLIPQLV